MNIEYAYVNDLLSFNKNINDLNQWISPFNVYQI
jgi:hypothetical protein